jgi:hypothetical protein
LFWVAVPHARITASAGPPEKAGTRQEVTAVRVAINESTQIERKRLSPPLRIADLLIRAAWVGAGWAVSRSLDDFGNSVFGAAGWILHSIIVGASRAGRRFSQPQRHFTAHA